MIIKKIQKNKNFLKNLQQNSGFVLLFAVTLAAIFLSIALGVGEIALKENQFGTSALNTNNAFFAADTGTEQALYNDLQSSAYASPGAWSFTVSGLGSNGQSCTIVNITKTGTPPANVSTTVVSNGYDIGGGGSAGTCTKPSSVVERDLTTTY
jgi:hypothetical protein